MIVKNSVTVILFLAGLIFSMTTPAAAEERVLGSWIAKGKVFPIGNEKVVFYGEAKGTVHHRDGKGKLDTGKLYCTASIYIDEQSHQEEGSGFCTITTINNDKIYANFTCAGPIKKCKGKFKHLGGTGEFKGISGETDLTWKVHLVRSSQRESSIDFVEQEVSGYFLLPNLTYTLP